jgi:tRNA threonylcarbamoyladenosine biosynthesis protein TsaE
MKKVKIYSDSSFITQKIASEIARMVCKNKSDSARVITLKGDLGSGKTTFVLGFLKYFGIKPHAISPTFVIMKKYRVKNKELIGNKMENIYHIDAYRLNSKKDLEVLDFDRIFKNPQNTILIEWPEKIAKASFSNKIEINFYHGRKENERVLFFPK